MGRNNSILRQKEIFFLRAINSVESKINDIVIYHEEDDKIYQDGDYLKHVQHSITVI